MLIFSRSVGDGFRIGDDVLVKVLSVKGKAVRLGIEAPRELPVHREEIYRKAQLAKQEVDPGE